MLYFVLLLIMGKDAHLKTESFFFVITLKNRVTRTFLLEVHCDSVSIIPVESFGGVRVYEPFLALGSSHSSTRYMLH
jgi:hypothetical protein